MVKRKTITKKTRFEVFKRDSFKCQYCGATSPDVLLVVDHIKPVVEGGTNEITNLIASCEPCNQGKGARLLDDNASLEKQRKQLEELNEKREQLEMMMQWHEELISLGTTQINYIADRWRELTETYSLNDSGVKSARKLLKKYPLHEILDAMETSALQYLKKDKSGKHTQESVEKAWEYIGRIIATERRAAEKPYLKELYYMRGILRNRLNYCNDWKALQLLETAYLQKATLESLRNFCLNVKNWTNFVDGIETYLEEHGGGDDEE